MNDSLTPDLACQVGLAVATCAKAEKAVVGRDTRLSGPMLEDALVAGLTSAGVNVTSIGIVPTPAVAYLTRELGADVGLMLTASHNPPQYNGIKVFRKSSLSFTNRQQNMVEKAVFSHTYSRTNWRTIGSFQELQAEQLYVDLLTQAVKLQKPWRIVVDPGCGATYGTAPKALTALGCKTTAINAQPDGYFPARSSEPTPQSLQQLAKTVVALNADLGVAFDGDGDRVAFVDADGAFVDFDRSLAAYAAYALERNGGGTVVTNVEASMCIEKMAQRYDGKVIRVRVGDVYVSEAIAQKKAVFGGEPCGAWVHPRFHWCPDGPLSTILTLKALEDKGQSLEQFIEDVPNYATLRENLPCGNKEKQEIVSKIEKTVKAAFPEFTDFSRVDGVRLALSNGWLLIRASGTEPLVRLTVEGESLKAARNIMKRSVELVQQSGGGAEC